MDVKHVRFATQRNYVKREPAFAHASIVLTMMVMKNHVVAEQALIFVNQVRVTKPEETIIFQTS